MTIDRGDLILAILRAADEQGERALLTTALMKYLYLADVYAAEASHGSEILSGAAWRFLHFGPYAAELQGEVDRLVRAGLITDQPWATDDVDEVDERAYRAYALLQLARAPTFEAVGVPRYVRTRLPSAIKRYGSDLSPLLTHVYFETTPMAGARPGAPLDFSRCRRVDASAFKPVAMRALSNKRVKRGREAIRRLAERETAVAKAASAHAPRYDEVYRKALAELDEEPLPVGLEGRAKLR